MKTVAIQGGWINKQLGYKFICINGKQIQEHRYVMEQKIGRKLNVSELVHHINENKLDNRIENLMIVSRSEHKKIHKQIGANTRLKKKIFLNKNEVLSLYNKLKSTQRVAFRLNVSQPTIWRFIIKFRDISMQ